MGKINDDIEAIVQENEARQALIRSADNYDPLHGINCAYAAGRVAVEAPWTEGRELVPPEMLRDPEYTSVSTPLQWQRLRSRYDFEYWGVKCAHIRNKKDGRIIMLRLNRGQRRLLEILEGQRRGGKPIRAIVLKARQWGCSTLVQLYMSWIQCCLKENWHSLLCAHNATQAGAIRGMLSRVLDLYPQELWGDGSAAQQPRLEPFQGQRGIRTIAGRSCNITLATSENVNSARGSDYAMAHLTEVAFWRDTAQENPESMMATVCGCIGPFRDTLIVMESTANGVGNFFHREWLRCRRGEGDKEPLFVPWYENEACRMEVADPGALWRAMDDYERSLWERGLTLENIAWYHQKRSEYQDHRSMMAENPTTPEEAFASSASMVFSAEAVKRLRPGCAEIRPETGDVASASGAVTGPESLERVSFRRDSAGWLKVWRRPQPRGEYIVTVDVGGRTQKADWSVIAVFATHGECPEVVAQWRGHIDHDLLTWKAAQIATWYNTALLVFESNSLEHGHPGEPTMPQGAYMLHILGDAYPNLYYRNSPGEDRGMIPGFHTNRATKQMIVTEMIAAVRDGRLIERDDGALDEMECYELRPNGVYAASDGNHDDRVMTRAIAVHVAANMPRYTTDPPVGPDADPYEAFAACVEGRSDPAPAPASTDGELDWCDPDEG